MYNILAQNDSPLRPELAEIHSDVALFRDDFENEDIRSDLWLVVSSYSMRLILHCRKKL